MARHCSAIVMTLLGVFLCVTTNSARAQFTLNHTDGNVDFRNALELFNKEKYVPAQEYFGKSIQQIEDVHSEIRIDAEYYYAICAIELFHDNASSLLKAFIENHPESNHIIEARFNLAKFLFRKKKHEDVIDYLKAIDPLDLESEEVSEYYFKLGYSHFQLDEFDEASKYFYEIKDTDNPYVAAARYYYAHIAYHQGKYETAASNFQKIEKDQNFGPLVPYYLTQIYYLQKKYKKVIEYAPSVLDSAPPKRESEIRKLIGNSHYELGEYEQSVSYLEEYLKSNAGSNEDYYQLGYAYYSAQKNEAAKTYLQKAISSNDTMNQNAYYYIGELNIRLDDKRAAKDAFRSAYKLGVDEELTEDALFNYAKTAYELSSHPYDNAILAFEEYINTYPNSSKLSDAYEYLLGVYYTTKNYKEALKSIDRIKDKSIELLEAKQRIAHYRGVELFRSGDFKGAIEHFNLSRSNFYDPKLYATSLFWRGEAFYNLGDYQNADDSYSNFLATNGALMLPFYSRAYYSLAYANYEMKKYKSAIFWFREYLDNPESGAKGLENDALLRIGDSYFIQKEYRSAIEYYDRSADLGVKNSDYALMQSAISSGVLGSYQDKALKLARLSENKSSLYADDALFELGKVLLIMEKQNDALASFTQLVQDYPKSSFLAEAYLKIGLIQFNDNQDEIALSYFDKVIKEYPSSSQSKEALDKVRKIFIDKSDAQGFEDYINGVPFADISKGKLDSTAYVIAENNYLSGNCEKATRDLSNYLNRYPEGIFSLNAHFYRAECEAKSSFDQEAIMDYKYVTEQATNKFTEKSWVQLAKLYQRNQQLSNAIQAYQNLYDIAQRSQNKDLAEKQLMLLHFENEQFEEATSYAKVILEKEQTDAELIEQSKVIIAKSAFESENYDSAIVYLDSLADRTTAFGAEAKYMLARIYYLKGDYNKSDTLIYRIVDQVPSQSYWIAKGFILLADNFVSRGDYYNARITFQSVIDNSDDKDLVEIAKEKLEILKGTEELNESNETAPIEIIMDEENVKNDRIFNLEETTGKGGKND